MADKRSAKNSADRVTTLPAFVRDFDMYFNDTSEAADADKDKPVASTVLKLLIDHITSQVWRSTVHLTAPTTDFVVLYGGEITINGSIYTVKNVGYAYYNNEIYKINTGTATLVDTIRLVLSSTEDGQYKTLDIQDGTSGSGVVDYADIKRIGDVHYIKYESWDMTLLGELNIAGINVPRITALSSNRVAYIDGTNDDLRVYEFDGSTWTQIGNDLNITPSGGIFIAAMSSTRVAWIDTTSEDLRVYDFDGTNWSQTGNDLNIAGSGSYAICALSSSRIAYFDTTNLDLRAYDFDGTDWTQTGNDLVISGASGSARMCTMTSSRIAFFDAGNFDLRVYDFDGTDWTQTGNDLNLASISLAAAMTAITSDRIILYNDDTDALEMYEFDGTDWAEVGNGFAIASIGNPTITALSSNKIAMMDSTQEDLRAYKILPDFGTPQTPPFN